jgi:hypothetical protein
MSSKALRRLSAGVGIAAGPNGLDLSLSGYDN